MGVRLYGPRAPPTANLATTRNILAPTEWVWLGDVYIKLYVMQGRVYQESDGYWAITKLVYDRYSTN